MAVTNAVSEIRNIPASFESRFFFVKKMEKQSAVFNVSQERPTFNKQRFIYLNILLNPAGEKHKTSLLGLIQFENRS